MKKKSLTCIRFDTCYLGHYYEIYYVFLQITPHADNYLFHLPFQCII